MKSKRSKACDISQAVKEKVWERDNGRCVVCGNNYNVMPNSHFISRANGGLGIEENIVTLCTNFTTNKCHYKYDNGTREEREQIGAIIENYLKSKYLNWNKENLTYKKGELNGQH
jgi:5-methylcytosine-specific restriction endonuclease McrA